MALLLMNGRLTFVVGVVFTLLLGFYHLKAQIPIQVGNSVEFGEGVATLSEPGRLRLQQEVNRLYADRNTLNAQLEQLRQLDPFIQEALQKASLPGDFRFLALPFDAQHGYWYLSLQLANRLGLQTNQQIDERYHPLLATQAATGFLASSYSRTTNSLRTAIDYLQAAEGTQMQPMGGDGPFLLLDLDSPQSIWNLLARRLVFNHEDPSFRPNRTFMLWAHEGRERTLTDVAFQYNLPTDRLQPYDSWLKASVLPSEKIHQVLIRMTPDEYARAVRQRFGERANSLGPSNPDSGFPVLRKLPPVKSALNTTLILYEINSLPGIQAQPGDNVITLAFYGKISVRQFMEYNDMTEQDVIRPGEVYYLAPKLKRAAVPFHVMDRGQTMRDVANQYGVPLKTLLAYNDLEANQRVQEGRIIWLQKKRPKNQPVELRQLTPRPQTPAPSPPQTEPVEQEDSTSLLMATDSLEADSTLIKPVSASVASVSSATTTASGAKARIHSVQPGQTYFSIARQYGISTDQLYRLNNLSERVPLRVGQKLLVDITGVTTKPPSLKVGTTASKSVKTPAPSARPREQGLKTYFRIERIPVSEGSVKSSTVNTASPAEQFYIVQPGQTIYRVALINNVTVEQIIQWNNLRDQTLQPGQRLLIRK